MPCLFLENVPEGVEWLPEILTPFHEGAKEVLGDALEVHIRKGVTYTLLTPEGKIPALDHGVHGWIEWHEGRTKWQRLQIGHLLRDILAAHRIPGKLDLAFVDYEHGISFYYDGKLIK